MTQILRVQLISDKTAYVRIKYLCGFLIGLVLSCTLLAEDVPLTNNPYAFIAIRNVFGLSPPQQSQSVLGAVTDLPEQITPDGIMSVLGKRQVLIKVSIDRSGTPPQKKSYILSEGQREDGIEVLNINEQKKIIEFNNNGTIQYIPLIAVENVNMGGEIFIGNHLRRSVPP